MQQDEDGGKKKKGKKGKKEKKEKKDKKDKKGKGKGKGKGGDEVSSSYFVGDSLRIFHKYYAFQGWNSSSSCCRHCSCDTSINTQLSLSLFLLLSVKSLCLSFWCQHTFI